MTGDRPPSAFLGDILAYAGDAVTFLSGHTLATLAMDKKTVAALEWCLVVIGEASKRLPPEVRRRCPDLPWRGMAAMRDRLVHGYFSAEINYIWQTVVEDLPALLPAVRTLRDELVAEEPPPPEAPS